MNSALSSIPIPRRRRVAATLGLFAVLFVAVGAVSATSGTPVTVRVFAGVAFVVAAALGLIAWGLLHSIKLDRAELDLDAAIEDVIASGGVAGLSCGCGHEHDPSELHVTDADDAAACGADGHGANCSHSCDTCVLAAMRPSPTTPRTERLSH